MIKGIRAVFVSTAAGILVLSGPAAAQQQNLAESEVRGFFEAMEQEAVRAVQAVQAGDFKQLIEWTQNNISDEATFTVTNEVYRDDERVGFATMTLGKQDMLGLSRAAVGMMSGIDGQTISDYRLKLTSPV